MSAYLERVLCHHDDWIVFSTALLERAWLEFEGTHTKERSLLQMQALADQHTNRLTITQSTRKSVEELSPVQDQLKNIHSIVYPPRWHMLKDVADRYAELGIVTSAAELFSEIQYWDEAVICYRRAGKMKLAEWGPEHFCPQSDKGGVVVRYCVDAITPEHSSLDLENMSIVVEHRSERIRIGCWFLVISFPLYL